MTINIFLNSSEMSVNDACNMASNGINHLMINRLPEMEETLEHQKLVNKHFAKVKKTKNGFSFTLTEIKPDVQEKKK